MTPSAEAAEAERERRNRPKPGMGEGGRRVGESTRVRENWAKTTTLHTDYKHTDTNDF